MSVDVIDSTQAFRITLAAPAQVVGGEVQLTPANLSVGSGGPGVFTTITASGTAAIAGNFTVNTNKFAVVAGNGNTSMAGTLTVSGATASLPALSCTTLAASGDVAVATNKFTVSAGTGNTAIAGTLGVTGNITVVGTAKAILPGLDAGPGGNRLVVDAVTGTISMVLQTFADNAAALGGGLVAPNVYQTATGELRIVV